MYWKGKRSIHAWVWLNNWTYWTQPFGVLEQIKSVNISDGLRPAARTMGDWTILVTCCRKSALMKRSIGLASSCRWGPGRVRQGGLRDVCDGQRVTCTLPMDTYGPMVSTQVVEAAFSDACSFCWFLPSIMKSISVLLDWAFTLGLLWTTLLMQSSIHDVNSSPRFWNLASL